MVLSCQIEQLKKEMVEMPVESEMLHFLMRLKMCRTLCGNNYNKILNSVAHLLISLNILIILYAK